MIHRIFIKYKYSLQIKYMIRIKMLKSLILEIQWLIITLQCFNHTTDLKVIILLNQWLINHHNGTSSFLQIMVINNCKYHRFQVIIQVCPKYSYYHQQSTQKKNNWEVSPKFKRTILIIMTKKSIKQEIVRFLKPLTVEMK
jgi:hypothetical protein